MLQSYSDEELVRRYLNQGQESAFSELFKRYKFQVFGFCKCYLNDNEDCKDVMMSVFEKILNFDKGISIRHFKRMLFTMTRNACIDFIKVGSVARRKKAEVIEVATSYYEMSEEEPAYEFFNDSCTEILYGISNKKMTEAMNLLKQPQKTCLSLFYYEKKSYKEIQSITGFELIKIKSHIQNGRRKLKIILGKPGRK